MQTAKKKISSVLCLLLVLCLLTVSAQAQLPGSIKTTGTSEPNALFAPSLADGSASLFTLDSRAGFSYLNAIFPDASILAPIPPVFSGESERCLKALNNRVVHRADRSVFPIRAPPCRLLSNT